MTIRTRFAPSPTGFLHIGSARTALFNYLFAKKHGGEFLLRIEDTDIKRSTVEAKQAILESMKWLDILWDGEIIYQTNRADRHREVAQQLISEGKAYYCFTSQDEIAVLREQARTKKEHFLFKSPWRDVDPKNYPKDINPVVRLKAPSTGQTIVRDLLQGDVTVENSHMDDMIILRSDGTSTYMLAVVVDDYDMGITHIIRGDDHLNNASRQQLIYDAMGWKIPEMVHIPLIHGPDGAKLSKRHGALGAEQYRNMGYLPQALCNYLLRLGWSHGDDEFITKDQAIKWFDIEHLGKSPSRIDFDKMKSMNTHYMQGLSTEQLIDFIPPELLSEKSRSNIIAAIDDIKQRANLVTDLLPLAKMYFDNSNILPDQAASEVIRETDAEIIRKIENVLSSISEFDSSQIQEEFKNVAKTSNMKLGQLMKIVRALIVGQVNSPSMFNMIAIIGAEEALRRVKNNK